MKNKAVFDILKVLTNLGVIDKVVAYAYYADYLTDMGNRMREKWLGEQ